MLWQKIFFLKAGNDSESLRSSGRLFQTRGAATEKRRSPKAVLLRVIYRVSRVVVNAFSEHGGW